MKDREVLTEVIDIDGKEFFLIDTIDKYVFYAEEANPENFLVLKEVNEDGEDYIISLDDESEYERAISLYYEKYRDAYA